MTPSGPAPGPADRLDGPAVHFPDGSPTESQHGGCQILDPVRSADALLDTATCRREDAGLAVHAARPNRRLRGDIRVRERPQVLGDRDQIGGKMFVGTRETSSLTNTSDTGARPVSGSR